MRSSSDERAVLSACRPSSKISLCATCRFRGDGRPGAPLPRTRAMGLEAASRSLPPNSGPSLRLSSWEASSPSWVLWRSSSRSSPRLDCASPSPSNSSSGSPSPRLATRSGPCSTCPAKPRVSSPGRAPSVLLLASVLWSAAIARTMYAALHARSSKVGTPTRRTCARITPSCGPPPPSSSSSRGPAASSVPRARGVGSTLANRTRRRSVSVASTSRCGASSRTRWWCITASARGSPR